MSSNEQEPGIRHFIALKRPGWAAEKKVPRNSYDGTTAMLREIYALYPDAECMVIRVIDGRDIWLEDGREWLCTDENMAEVAAESPR